MKTLFALALFVAVPLSAQLQETVHVASYATRTAAAAALPGYVDSASADLVPVRITSPFFGMYRAVYAVNFQPVIGEDESCSTFGSSPLVPITYVDACATVHTLTVWVARAFTSASEQRQFYFKTGLFAVHGLSEFQRGTAYILTSPSAYVSPYLVVYQEEYPARYVCEP